MDLGLDAESSVLSRIARGQKANCRRTRAFDGAVKVTFDSPGFRLGNESRGIRDSIGLNRPSFFAADRECSLIVQAKRPAETSVATTQSLVMKELAENIWVLPYSLRLFGADLCAS